MWEESSWMKFQCPCRRDPREMIPHPCEAAMRIQPSENQEESFHKEQRCNLGLLDSRTLRHKFLLFQSLSLWYSVMAAQAKTRSKIK